MTSEQEFAIQRIVVALDSSAQAAAALKAAARLAARIHAEIEGVFVEDINLARLAELPVGREISLPSGKGRDFTERELDAQYRQQADSARRAMRAELQHTRVRHSFRVARGEVSTEVVTAAAAADLLILGMSGHSSAGRTRIGRTAIAAIRRAPRSVLLSKPGVRISGNVMICYDGGAGGLRALQAAVLLHGAAANSLSVVIEAATPAEAERLRTEVSTQLQRSGVQARFLPAVKNSAERLCERAQEVGAEILVMGADDPMLSDESLLQLLGSIHCQVLVVR